MQSVNRTVVVIRPKQPFVDWLNSVPGENSDNTLEDISTENTTFLIPEFDFVQDSLECVKEIYSDIFRFELFGWYTDDELWPRNRTWEMFQEWFEIEINSEVFDLVDEAIKKEEM